MVIEEEVVDLPSLESLLLDDDVSITTREEDAPRATLLNVNNEDIKYIRCRFRIVAGVGGRDALARSRKSFYTFPRTVHPSVLQSLPWGLVTLLPCSYLDLEAS